MNAALRKVTGLALLGVVGACSNIGKPPPHIPLDVPSVNQAAKPLVPARAGVSGVGTGAGAATLAARSASSRGQSAVGTVWPFRDNVLYSLNTRPGRVTVIGLEPGESIVTIGAGDTSRWMVEQAQSGHRPTVLVKPVHAGLSTNLVIHTDRRTYLIDLTASNKAWTAAVSWEYVSAVANPGQARTTGNMPAIALDRMHFRYAITGGNPPWRPRRAFDDGSKVYIEFPAGIAQGELPPLFAIGPQGDMQLVNHRFRAPYYIVDRLFGAAELRLGSAQADVVRIERNDVARSED